MQYKEIVYGARYLIMKGFYRDSIAIAVGTTEGVTPPKVKIRIVQTKNSNKPLPDDLVVEVWAEPGDLEKM